MHIPLNRSAVASISLMFGVHGCATLESSAPGAVSDGSPTAANQKQATGATPPMAFFATALERVLDPDVAELRKKADAGDIDGVLALYTRDGAKLDAKPNAVKILEVVATKLNSNKQHAWNQQAVHLSETKKMPPASEWATLKAELGRARVEMGYVESNPLLRKPAYRSTAFKALEAATRNVEKDLASDAGRQFAAYLPEMKNFFEDYPGVLSKADQTRIVDENRSALNLALASMPEADAGRIAAAYLPATEAHSPARRAIINGWIASTSRQANRPSGKIAIARKFEAIERLRMVVPNVDLAPAFAVLPVVSSQASPAHQTAAVEQAQTLSRMLKVQTLPPVGGAQVNELLVSKLSSDFDFILLMHPGRTGGGDLRVGTRTQPAKYVVRNDVRPNPEHQQTQQALDLARDNVRRAEVEERTAYEQAKTMARQSSSTLGGLAAAAMLSAGTFGTMSKREEVDRIEATLRDIPPTVSRPVYDSYERKITDHLVGVMLPSSAYIVDLGTEQIRRVNASRTAKYEYFVIDNQHPNDPDTTPEWTDEKKQEKRLQTIKGLEASVPESLASMEKIKAAMAGEWKPLGQLAQHLQEDESRFVALTEEFRATLKSR